MHVYAYLEHVFSIGSSSSSSKQTGRRASKAGQAQMRACECDRARKNQYISVYIHIKWYYFTFSKWNLLSSLAHTHKHKRTHNASLLLFWFGNIHWVGPGFCLLHAYWKCWKMASKCFYFCCCCCFYCCCCCHCFIIFSLVHRGQHSCVVMNAFDELVENFPSNWEREYVFCCHTTSFATLVHAHKCDSNFKQRTRQKGRERARDRKRFGGIFRGTQNVCTESHLCTKQHQQHEHVHNDCVCLIRWAATAFQKSKWKK